MKKILLSTAILLLAVTATHAQIRREKKTYVADSATAQSVAPRPEDDKMKRKEMMKELNLSRDQQKQMKEIMQGMKAKKDAIEADSTLARPARMEKMKALRMEQLDKMQKLLTPEQFEKWKELRQGGKKGEMKKEEPVNQ